ncbi:MAG: ggt [Bacteroidetes bacterium]|jgi:gamma-glutamyltranspeptidase/glutathione hydrolase|nr:ggt [Bacteroidota bacterium]
MMRIGKSILLITLCLIAGCDSRPTPFYRADQDTVFVRSARASTAMVVSAHPAASEAGVATLRAGGNAADAAIAAVTALNVTEPHASGLGGGGFCLFYDAQRDSFFVIDYRERAPRGVDRTLYYSPADTLRRRLEHGATAVATPGAPAGWQAIVDRFCTKPLAELLGPAIAAADTGFVLTEKQVAILMDHLSDIESDPAISAVFLDDGFPPEPGFRVKQPHLAATMRSLGATSFTRLYRSPFAEDIVGAVRARGGALSMDDLASYRVQVRRPLRGWYNGFEIITLPPPSLGGTALLEILRIAEKCDLKSKSYLSADYVHCLAAASRQALTDVNTWISDPDFDEQPVSSLLSDEWVTDVSRRLEQEGAGTHLSAWHESEKKATGNTTHLVIVDSAGNIVSLTQSINDFYGAGVMAPRSGILLNNHMGDFSGDSTRKNSVKPFHRPASNMAATIVRKGGKPVLVIGSPGGPRIAPAVAHVITAVLDGQLSLENAIKAPRFFPRGNTLVLETRMPAGTVEGLRARGWKIEMNGSTNAFFGGVHAIQIDTATGGLTGAADPRRDGAPVGW